MSLEIGKATCPWEVQRKIHLQDWRQVHESKRHRCSQETGCEWASLWHAQSASKTPSEFPDTRSPFSQTVPALALVAQSRSNILRGDWFFFSIPRHHGCCVIAVLG